jgi:hypothetical protein
VSVKVRSDVLIRSESCMDSTIRSGGIGDNADLERDGQRSLPQLAKPLMVLGLASLEGRRIPRLNQGVAAKKADGPVKMVSRDIRRAPRITFKHSGEDDATSGRGHASIPGNSFVEVL